jgi:hypothetical protein
MEAPSLCVPCSGKRNLQLTDETHIFFLPNHCIWRGLGVGRNPLDEWSARQRDPNLHQLTTLTRHTNSYPWRDSNSQSQQVMATDLCFRPRGNYDRLTDTNVLISFLSLHSTSVYYNSKNVALYNWKNHFLFWEGEESKHRPRLSIQSWWQTILRSRGHRDIENEGLG